VDGMFANALPHGAFDNDPDVIASALPFSAGA
jgi:hypothetical protein